MSTKVKKMNQSKGITLIALVVTMVILLILAGITVRLIAGDDGVIKKAQKVENKYTNNMENQEEKLNELEEDLEKQTSRRVAIRIVGEDNLNEPLFDCLLGVYKDSGCNQLFKQIYVDDSLPVSKGYSYESDTILENGTYYIKMIRATTGYELNTQIFKFEVANGRNALTIKLEKKYWLPSSLGKIQLKKEGNTIRVDNTIPDGKTSNVIVEYTGPDLDASGAQPKILMEPVAKYNSNINAYEYIGNFASLNLTPLSLNNTEEKHEERVKEQIAEFMESSGSSYANQISIENGQAQGLIFVKYAYIIKFPSYTRNGEIKSPYALWIPYYVDGELMTDTLRMTLQYEP